MHKPETRREFVTLPALLLTAAGVVAFLIRLLPLLGSGTLGGFRGYDDGVHYSSGVNLLAGAVPYRDFVLVHPPGIALLMAPFAAVGGVVSDQAGISLARVLFVLIGTLNTVLIGMLLRKWGSAAVIAGAGVYALWPAATIAERSVMLSPLLSVFVLASLLALQSKDASPRRNQIVLAGVFLGLALCFKVWAVLPILVVAVMVGVRWGPRELLRFAGAGTLVGILVMGPFFILAPGAMYNDVVSAQLGRPETYVLSLADRLRDFAGVGASSGVVTASVIVGVVCVLLTVISGLRGSPRTVRGTGLPVPRLWGEEVWWAFLAIVIVTVLLISNTFFDHYPNFAAPYLALCLGVVVGKGIAAVNARVRLLASRQRKWKAPIGILGAVVGAAILFPLGGRGVVLEPSPLPGVSDSTLSAAVAPYACVFSTYAYMGVISDSLSRSTRHGCDSIVDVFGMRLVQDSNTSGREKLGSLQVLAADLQIQQLKTSQAAVVGFPLADYGLSAGAIKELERSFVLKVRSGSYQVWIRR